MKTESAAAPGMARQENVPTDTSADAMRCCPNCSTTLLERRCKLACPTCGFYLSCSDFH